jgi:hypothetical protein
LLDDIFDKIDEKRVNALMRRVTSGTFGQVFITDTDVHRIPRMFQETGADVKVYLVEQGEVKEALERRKFDTMNRKDPKPLKAAIAQFVKRIACKADWMRWIR